MRASSLWQELGDRVFRRRYPYLDQNIGVVLGEEAVLIVDTRANPALARELLSELAMISDMKVGWVFNTHYHWDHTFGNQCFSGAAMWGHEECRRELIDHGAEMIEDLLPDLPPKEREAMRELVITPPSQTFTERVTIDIGGRVVELAHLGLGHTNSDAVMHVDGVTFAGDLIEEGGPPSVGDSFPISWVDTVGRLAAEARPVVVPGHGDVVDVEYVVVTRFDLAWIALRAEDAWKKGLSLDQVDLSGSPYPTEVTTEALARAYSELDSSTKFSQ